MLIKILKINLLVIASAFLIQCGTESNNATLIAKTIKDKISEKTEKAISEIEEIDLIDLNKQKKTAKR